MKTLQGHGPSKHIDDEDSHLLERLRKVEVRPVFIIGLHRSGTTFLYESLVRLLPLAYLTPYHIVFYRRLLSRHLAGSASADQEYLNDCFAEWGQRDRGVDGISLSSATPEEYGWLLKRYAGSVRFGPKTAPLFDEMCRKLLTIQARDVVLLKNPWDTARAVVIHKHFPQARFIYISRDPVAILQSQLGNALLFSTTRSRYLEMLLKGFPAGKVWFGIQRAVYRVGGERLFARLILPVLMRDIIGELKSYQRTFRELPEDRRMEVSYEQLTTQFDATLTRISGFLELSPPGHPSSVEPRPRGIRLHPEVARTSERFVEKLEKMGLVRDSASA